MGFVSSGRRRSRPSRERRAKQPFAIADGETPQNVGIHAIETCLPEDSVRQFKLSTAAGVSKALTLEHASASYDSIMITSVQNLFDKYELTASDIGHIEVVQAPSDGSKQTVKSTLLQMLTSNGTFDVDGMDKLDACDDKRIALLNTMTWMRSPAYDGRFGLVVCGDVPVPTGGHAAVAMLVGPDAPTNTTGARASHSLAIQFGCLRSSL